MGYLGALLMGIFLGLLGSGGSILSLPIFVYFFNIQPHLATAYSLLVVAVVAGIGFLQKFRSNKVRLNRAVGFALPSVVGIFLVRHFFLPRIPSEIKLFDFSFKKDLMILLVFSVVMVKASLPMIAPKSKQRTRQIGRWQVAGHGFFVGALAGFVGAGGGFLIIPALVNELHVPIKEAAVISLGIIMLNSIVGVVSDLSLIKSMSPNLVISFLMVAILGLVIGGKLQGRVTESRLKPIFGYFVLITGFLILARELSHLF